MTRSASVSTSVELRPQCSAETSPLKRDSHQGVSPDEKRLTDPPCLVHLFNRLNEFRMTRDIAEHLTTRDVLKLLNDAVCAWARHRQDHLVLFQDNRKKLVLLGQLIADVL